MMEISINIGGTPPYSINWFSQGTSIIRVYQIPCEYLHSTITDTITVVLRRNFNIRTSDYVYGVSRC